MRLRPRYTLPFAAAAAAAALVTTTLYPHAEAKPVKAVASSVPTPAHVVVVMEENHSYSDIIGNSSAPYMNSLASQGALLTSSFGVTHPSEPNYMALFAGSTFGLSADTCPVSEGSDRQPRLRTARRRPHLQGLLGRAAQDRFDDLHLRQLRAQALALDQLQQRARPRTRCPSSSFPTDYTKLPTLSFVIPNLNDDMHNGTIAQADTWLKNNLSAYATWAKSQQQPARRHLGRGRLHREQPDPHDLRRREREGRPLQRRPSTTTTCSPRWSSSTA